MLFCGVNDCAKMSSILSHSRLHSALNPVSLLSLRWSTRSVVAKTTPEKVLGGTKMCRNGNWD